MITNSESKRKGWLKAFLVIAWLAVSVLGFMVKLPRSFRHYDKELHATFYFLAAAFLNILFTNGKFTRHILIFALLYLFSVSIELAQEFFRIRIHGRYDPEDVKYNLRGLIAYSLLWVSYRLALTVYNKFSYKEATDRRN
jgi:hypothetical protein